MGYDPNDSNVGPTWLVRSQTYGVDRPLFDGFLQVKANEETWDTVKTALYWYMRSNTKEAGVDGSLILSQCALELLS